ncbi:MAG: RDD family protein [Burkholderiales bacterium]
MNDPAASAVARASFGRRLGSLCYDLLLLTAILFTAAWIFLVIQTLLPASLVRPVFQLYLLAVSGAYFMYCWTHGGQTLPMKTWRIRVVARDGGPLNLRQAARRSLCALASTALGGMGFVWALVDRDRQFLHDRLAGTRIIQC